MPTNSKVYLKMKVWLEVHATKIKHFLFAVILVLPLVVCCIFNEKIAEPSLFKDIGCSLAIVSALFSFTFSWLLDSKNFLSYVYDIPEAKKLYDNANRKSLVLVETWERAFIFSTLIVLIGYLLQNLTANLNPKYFIVIITYVSLSSALVLTVMTIYFILNFFATAKEILKFRNDLEQIIVEEKQSKDIPPFL